MRSSRTLIVMMVALGIQAKALGQETYRGVRVEPEVRCAPYDRDEYLYPQSVESQIIAGIGGIYGPYTGPVFRHGARDGHRAYRAPVRSPRQRPVLRRVRRRRPGLHAMC